MKKTTIIFLLILTIILGYFIWDSLELRRLETAAKEISPLAKRTIESLYMGESKFINAISGTDEVKGVLQERMKHLQNIDDYSLDVMQTMVEKINVYEIIILSTVKTAEAYAELYEYRLKFKKKHKKWIIVDFKYRRLN
ncbi:hypothetical protein R9X47_24395 [Wukongibacter baidiensis]|uniref:hypothetical protein n=1 Tax=Wukongibacter baidiensis TaxID=1723361 RepID=UPI003D7FB820